LACAVEKAPRQLNRGESGAAAGPLIAAGYVIRYGSILFLRFQLIDECSEMRGDGSCEGVVLESNIQVSVKMFESDSSAGGKKGFCFSELIKDAE
jgi:hypothetical protein